MRMRRTMTSDDSSRDLSSMWDPISRLLSTQPELSSCHFDMCRRSNREASDSECIDKVGNISLLIAADELQTPDAAEICSM